MDKIKEYFASKRISNSLLGALSNPRWVKMKMDNPDAEDEDKKHFRVGSALDCLLTSNGVFDDEFTVVDVVRPYGYMAKFVECLPSELTPESPIDHYREAYDKAGYKMKIERVIDSFWTNPTAVEYYNAVRSSKSGKTILSKDEYDVVIQCRDKILANSFTHKYFVNNDPNIELIHQLPIYFNYKNHECKALLDGVYINHREKYIQPFDLKTIGKSIYDFPTSFVQFGYYRQAAFYTEALANYRIKDRKEQGLSDISGYLIKDFIFIVVESKLGSSYPAIIYKTSDSDIDAGLYGGYKGEKYYKGVDKLLEAYDYHNFTQQWDLPMELFENEGCITLNVFTNENEKGTFSENTEST